METTVRDNPAELRYEALADGNLVGQISYRARPGRVVLIHTEVAPAAEGMGVASKLVKGALDDIRARGLRVVPVCRFVASYIGRHPEEHDLVAGDSEAPE
jgi:predicted GNAT family acetyltransferase